MKPLYILKGIYQTIIIICYDPLIFKMIPGIFIGISNKTSNGYNLIFNTKNNINMNVYI